MGFPNVDKILTDIFIAGLNEAKNDSRIVADCFEEMGHDVQAEISLYLSRLHVTGDIRDREDTRRYLYVLPHFPVSGYPFPQIGVSVGQESTSDKFLGDYSGDSFPVRDSDNNVIAWDVEKGYIASGSYTADIICSTKDEVVWLSRLCQYTICQRLQDLDQMGIKEVNITLGDPRIDPQSMTQPADVFARAVSLTAKVINTWKKRVPAYTYITGINKAVGGP